MNYTRYASRKFLLASAAWLAGVVFFALGKLDAALVDEPIRVCAGPVPGGQRGRPGGDEMNDKNGW